MKNVFTKFLLLAAVAGIFISCDKEEKEGAKKEPSNYMQIGSKKSAIVMGAIISGGPGDESRMLQCVFLGEGLSFTNNTLVGKGDAVEFTTPSTPGEYLVNWKVGIGAMYMKNYSVASDEEPEEDYVEGGLVEGMKIKWSKSGNVYTIDFEGNTILNDNSAGEFLKVHYVGELRDLRAELN